MEQVILVDEQDNFIGTEEKIKAHELALLHRAFSVFIFTSNGKMLLQQRAYSKYHSPGLWTNACCSHPRPNEKTIDAAKRRLTEELGFTVELIPAFTFTYKAHFDNGLTEHEFDHVFVGIYDGAINYNTQEVESYTLGTIEQIEILVHNNPQHYTEWFKIALPLVKNWLQQNSYLHAVA